MTDQPSTFAALMCAVQSGSHLAAQELFENYGSAVIRAVRKNLHRQMRSKFDSIDFVQDVWASFFLTCGSLRPFNNPGELIAFLTTMARNKVGQEFRRRMCTVKRNVTKERSLEDPNERSAADLKGHEATPSQIAMGRECWENLLKGQPAHYQEMLRLRSQGMTFTDIGSRLQMDERTIRRAFEKILGDRAR